MEGDASEVLLVADRGDSGGTHADTTDDVFSPGCDSTGDDGVDKFRALGLRGDSKRSGGRGDDK